MSNLFKDGGSPPPAPDPQATAGAQSQSNINTAIANARLNRVNQTTPWGSITYTQGPVDANGVPTYSSEIKLDPQQQAQLEEQRRQQTQRQQIAATLLGQAGGSLSKPLDLSGAHKVYDRYAGSTTQQPPTPQPPPAVPSAQSGSRDAMLAQLMQYLQSQGSAPTAGNPAARYAPLLNGSAGAGAAGSPAPSTSTTPAIPATSLQAANQANPFGTEGDSYRVPGRGNSGDSWEGDSFRDQYVPINGQQMIRVGHLPPGSSDYFKDPDKVQYDPRYGYVTSPDNLTGGSHETFYDKYAPYLMMALAGGGIAAEGAGLLGGSEGAVSAGTGAFDVGGSTGFGGTVPLETGAAPISAGAPLTDLSTGAVPVTDLSTTATQPSMGSQMMTNLQNGRGLLGLSGGQRAAVGVIPALIQLLRNGQGQRGK